LPVAQLVARGVWATATAYAKLHTVNAPDGHGYVCIAPHTSGVFANDLAANRWAKLVGAGAACRQGPAGATGATGATACTSRGFSDRGQPARWPTCLPTP
jgi:hypothetical protein